MLTYLEDEDVEILLETTFFVVNKYWPSFEEGSRVMTENLLKFILDRYEAIVKQKIYMLPSLIHISRLSVIENRLKSLRKNLDSRSAFSVFAQRIRNENSGVAIQGLQELVEYLRSNQGYLQASAISPQPDNVISTLLRALLDCAATYNGVEPDIALLCTECIGLVGCLDSNRIEAVRKQRSIVVVNNFELAEETTDFALFILEEVLVKAFLSSVDTRLQGFLSFAMQELLTKCDIRAACAMEGTGMSEGNAIYRKWLKLPESVREVLTPFLSSRYMLAPMASTPVDYPIFRPGKPYANWIRSFVLDLLRRPQTEFAGYIFEPLCRVIRVKDISISEFLLPYLVVHIIVGTRSSAELRDFVTGELVGILQLILQDDASYGEREDMKLFCQVRTLDV
jgi:serine/threonine-protein kinase ATR